MKKVILFISCLLMIVSCKDPWLGKTFPPGHYPQFSPGLQGHHNIPFEGGKVTLEYDWETNKERNRIWLVGTFEINIPEWKFTMASTFKEANITFKVLHLDRYYTVIGVNQIYIPVTNETSAEDFKFKRDFPYKSEYKYVTYRIEASGRS